ncbi:MAG: hypothetical protein NC305_13300 [Lachnospiraceae bacterium]|nr:hypothetical protein [Butyrivibrio sp.]MCM1344026.1 hypothetical protein [Muribaculaceae bacterium]MCM1411507.1 hypothetical protein [Lachnospiraceae bacterium]
MEAQGKPYTLRKFQARDISPMARIIGKIGIDEMISCYGDDDFTELMVKLKNRKKMVSRAVGVSGQDGENAIQVEVSEGSGNKDNSEFIVGVAVATRVANQILLNLDKCEKEVYGLLGSLSGMSAEEIADLDLEIFGRMITDIFRENNIGNFIRAATAFLK